MRNPEYSTVDPQTGNVTYHGPLEIMKGSHSNMPSRTEAYLPGDERGHVGASSLGGTNSRSNVVAQDKNVNHGGYLSVERGERSALKNGADIISEKTAVVDSQPGDRPTTFMVNDTVTYADHHTESIHHSFTNESYAAQSEWNDISAALPGTFEGANPGDSLRDSMGTAEYASLMEETDAALPNLADEYAPADFSGVPGSMAETGVGDGSSAGGAFAAGSENGLDGAAVEAGTSTSEGIAADSLASGDIGGGTIGEVGSEADAGEGVGADGGADSGAAGGDDSGADADADLE